MKNKIELKNLFSELEETFFMDAKKSVKQLLNSFYYESSIINKYLDLKKYFPPNVLKFEGVEEDLDFLISIRKHLKSETLKLYIEILIAKCKGGYSISSYSIKFQEYYKKNLNQIYSADSKTQSNFIYFVEVASKLFKKEYNLFFQYFISSIDLDKVNNDELFYLDRFLLSYGVLNKTNKNDVLEKCYYKLMKPVDDVETVFWYNSIFAKFIQHKIIDIKTIKYKFATLVDGISINNKHFKKRNSEINEFLLLAIKYLHESEIIDYELLNSLDNKLNYSNKETLAGIKEFNFIIPKDMLKDFEKDIEEIISVVFESEFIDSFFNLYKYLLPLPTDLVKKSIKATKETALSKIVNKTYHRDDGSIIIPINDKEKFSLEYRETIDRNFKFFYEKLMISFLEKVLIYDKSMM